MHLTRPLLAPLLALVLAAAACSDAAPAPAGPTPPPGTPASSPTVAPTPTLPAVGAPTGAAAGPASHEVDRALEHLLALAVGPRVAGTPGELRAAEYAIAQFRAFGYETELMSFEFDGDRFRAGEVRLAGRAIEALTMAGSPGGSVEAPSAYVGLADPAGIAGQDLSGRIAVAERGGLSFAAKYEHVRAAGAVGLVVVNNQPGPFSGNLTLAAAFPVVSVAREDGQSLLDAARAGQTLSITTPGTTALTTAYNVIARPPGESRCDIIVGGHYDSVPGTPGANDNASGAANVIELARALAVPAPRQGLCIALFGAEESGLYGSKALAERLAAASALPRYMINLDVTGIGSRVEVIGESPAATRALELARQAGIEAVPSSLPPNTGSDHMSFADLGVETVFFTSGDFSTIHSPLDTPDAIQPAILDAIGDAALLLILDLLPQAGRQ